MIALGIDVSSTKIACGAIDDNGDILTAVGSIATRLRGAHRLVEVRTTTIALAAAFHDAHIAIVEIPWARTASSFVLLSIAGVVLEALQTALPYAVVLERPTSTWKANSVGFGNATKHEVMEHAHGIGYEGDDQDVADAVCMASAAWAEWWRMEGRTA